MLLNVSILLKEIGNRWTLCQSVKLNDFGDNICVCECVYIYIYLSLDLAEQQHF